MSKKIDQGPGARRVTEQHAGRECDTVTDTTPDATVPQAQHVSSVSLRHGLRRHVRHLVEGHLVVERLGAGAAESIRQLVVQRLVGGRRSVHRRWKLGAPRARAREISWPAQIFCEARPAAKAVTFRGLAATNLDARRLSSAAARWATS